MFTIQLLFSIPKENQRDFTSLQLQFKKCLLANIETVSLTLFLLTAWNDGNIRAFTPLTGRLIYCILNTHNKGTSALDMTHDGRTLISGGCEGQVLTNPL